MTEEISTDKIEIEDVDQSKELAKHFKSFADNIPFSKKKLIAQTVDALMPKIDLTTEELMDMEDLVDEIKKANRSELHTLRTTYMNKIKELDETDEMDSKSIKSFLALIKMCNRRLFIEYGNITTNVLFITFLATLSSGGLIVIISVLTGKSIKEVTEFAITPLYKLFEKYKASSQHTKPLVNTVNKIPFVGDIPFQHHFKGDSSNLRSKLRHMLLN